MFMKSHIVQFKAAIAAFAIAVGMLVAPMESAQGTDKVIAMGTGNIAGVLYPLGGAICRLVNDGRKSHGQRCMVESTAGSISNINAIMSGDLEIGFAQGDAQYVAFKGLGPYKEKPQTKLRALFSAYPELFSVVARADANIRGFADLSGKRVNIGEPGSATRTATEILMSAFDIRQRDFKPASELKPDEMPRSLCDNRIDAFTFIVGHPSAIVQEATGACAANIVAVSGPAIDKVVKDFPFYAKASVPGRMYKGNDGPQPTVGVMVTVVTSADLPEQTAYLVTKAVFDSFEDFKKLHPALAHITKELMLEGNTAPFHPGALKYYKEKGLLK